MPKSSKTTKKSATKTTKTVKKVAGKTLKKAALARTPAKKGRTSAVRRPGDPLFDPVKGAIRRDIGHVQLEVGHAGAARVGA